VLDSSLKEIVPLKRVFEAIEGQILNGKTYLSISKAIRALLESHPDVFGTAPTFFGLTSEGGLELAQMTVARLYDRSRSGLDRAVTIRRMLEQSKREIRSFKYGDETEVNEAIAKAGKTVQGLEPILAAIKHRRNEWFAHLDVRTVANSQESNDRAKLTIADLERAFRETEEIVGNLTHLFDGAIGELRYLGGDDYRGMLERIRHSIVTEKEVFDAVFGKHLGDPPPAAEGS
ncbi:MAG: hypothetical protein WBQ89_06315, partial [Candidatus Acidiferrum sp.]